METMKHLSNEDLASYALKSLDPEEARTVEAHLSGCAQCRAELANYAQVADGLLFALPPKASPPALRARLAEQIAASPRPVSVPRPAAVQRPRFRLSFALAVGIVLLIALLAGNAFQAVQIQALQNREALLLKALSQEQAIAAVAAQPGVSVIPLGTNPVNGSLLISADQKNGVVFVKGLAELDAAHTYQMWLIPVDGAPLSAGLFQAQADQPTAVAIFSSTTPVKSYAAFGVTIEPSGGSAAPTTTPILLSKF
jgi:anti-sigma-K factor RskA